MQKCKQSELAQQEGGGQMTKDVNSQTLSIFVSFLLHFDEADAAAVAARFHNIRRDFLNMI